MATRSSSPSSWDCIGEIANVAQLTGFDAMRLIGMIVKAASTARMHKENCRQFAKHLELISGLLEPLNMSELKKHPGTRRLLEQLEDALRRSYILVHNCQDKSYLYLLAMGWNIVNQFRKAHNEIDAFLKLAPLMALVDNARVLERIECIEKHQYDYTLDDEDRKAQEAILKPCPDEEATMVLKKTLSCSYPGLPFNEALQKENEKLRLELQRCQANMDVSQQEVIQRLLRMMQVAASSVVEQNLGDKWHSHLLGCCAEPMLCLKTHFCPCSTFAKITTVAKNRHVSSAEACMDLTACSLILSCCCYSCYIRRKLRKALNITGGFVGDFLSHFMCCCCALVQEWREVEIRRAYGPEKTKISPLTCQQMEYRVKNGAYRS